MMTPLLIEDQRAWIGSVVLASEFTIAFCHLTIAAALFRSGGPSKPPFHTISLLGLAVCLCAFREVFGIVDAWKEAASDESMRSSVLKGAAAVFWGVTAYRFPAILNRLSRAGGLAYRCYRLDDGDRQADLQKSEEFSKRTQQLSLKARSLLGVIHNETWLLDQFESHQDLSATRDDVEMIQCKI